MPVLKLTKPLGTTPLEFVNDYKKKNPDVLKISYAGRLDPMAEGIMLVLTNEDCRQQNNYFKCEKIYEFEVLFGISTDSYDILGIIKNNMEMNDFNEQKQDIYNYISKLKGTHKQYYPPYSSVRINGKPLWHYAKTNLLDTIEIPHKEIEIKSIDILETYSLNSTKLLQLVENRINKLDKKHDFRQDTILDSWKSIKSMDYNVIKISSHVSSGTYVRELCNNIGKAFNIPTLTLSINRREVIFN